MNIKDLTINDIDRYIGMDCCLKVGLFEDEDYGFFCNVDNKIIFETRKLTMTYDPLGNEQILDFGNGNTIKIKHIRSTDITIEFNDREYVLSRG